MNENKQVNILDKKIEKAAKRWRRKKAKDDGWYEEFGLRANEV